MGRPLEECTKNIPLNAAIYQALLRQGVIVRPVGNYHLPASLRVTVGTPAENARFLAALAVAKDPRPMGIAHAG